MTALRFLPACFTASALLFASPMASATVLPDGSTCSVNADCGEGYECTVVGGSTCASPACPPGATCPAPEPCTPTEQKACTPAHCAADADCADGMLCHQWTEPCPVVACACPANAPDCECAQPACDPMVLSMCTPRYVLPCTTAADCGEGFTCEEAQSCGCASSGSSGSGVPTPGATPQGGLPKPPADSGAGGAATDCSCEPTGQFQCVAKVITCESAAQCPSGWNCEPPVATSQPACAGADCPPVAEPGPSQCRPAYYGATSGGDLAAPATPTSGNQGSGGGTTSGTPKSGTTDEASPPQATDDGAHESAACQIGHGPASRAGFSLLVVLGAMWGLKRRRSARG